MSVGEDGAGPLDAEDIARFVNSLFRAPPGGAPEAPRPVPEAPTAPALGGIGASPMAIPDAPPAVIGLAAPAAPLAPGIAGPADAGVDLGPPPAPRAQNGDLYVVTEALDQRARRSDPDGLNALATPLTYGMPGGEQLQSVLAPGLAKERGGADAQSGYPAYDITGVRRDFPILQEKINGRPLIWLDNGATTQKPQAVIDRLAKFYAQENSNVHRAAHTLAARATDAYENARKIAARFIGAPSADNIVFVRGATEGINLVAQAWGPQNVREGDEIIISHLEHHANIVPWQALAKLTGARLRVIPVDDDGQIIFDAFEKLLSPRTKIVAITHLSNALGTIVPIEAVIHRAHAAGAKVLIDAAQSVAHARINVTALDADFLVFSGHKIFAPTGIGVLYGKRDILAAMPPWQGGGNMISDVTFEQTVFREPPARFEAGTGNLADAVGLGAALEYVERIGVEQIAAYEHDLLEYAERALCAIPGLKLFGSAPAKASVLSFTLKNTSPQEVGRALDRYGIAVRAGHHCAQPILRRFGVEETLRASLALYNTRDEIDALATALREIVGNSRALTLS